MKREILFKAQRADGEGWINGFYVFELNLSELRLQHCIQEFLKDENGIVISVETYEVLPETVCENSPFFTTDHNGKHWFFEDDTYTNKGVDWVVKIIDGCWCFVKMSDPNHIAYMKDIPLYGDLIPTGNIHDK